MKKILIPENADDLNVVSDMIEQACDGSGKVNTSPEEVVVHPNMDKDAGWAKWCVVDNRDHQCFTEDFATLDGAMVYATDMETTTERQSEWDVEGSFAKRLKKDLEDVRTDPLAGWSGRGDDRDGLVEGFVTAVRHNVNGRHSVRYLTEAHDNGDGTSETEYLVEITYANSCGPMCEIDNALESMNGRDWRRVCDMFLKRRLNELGADPDNFDWPTPDARVTFDYYEDEDDIVKTVTLVWAMDGRTWNWCNPDTVTEVRADEYREDRGVVETCPHCDCEVSMKWDVTKSGYKAFCPFCGKELMLCDECLHAEDNPDMDCSGKCKRKGKKNGKS